jgi:hypothetical protein
MTLDSWAKIHKRNDEGIQLGLVFFRLIHNVIHVLLFESDYCSFIYVKQSATSITRDGCKSCHDRRDCLTSRQTIHFLKVLAHSRRMQTCCEWSER